MTQNALKLEMLHLCVTSSKFCYIIRVCFVQRLHTPSLVRTLSSYAVTTRRRSRVKCGLKLIECTVIYNKNIYPALFVCRVYKNHTAQGRQTFFKTKPHHCCKFVRTLTPVMCRPERGRKTASWSWKHF